MAKRKKGGRRQRQRRYRARLANGIIVAPVEVTHVILDLLIDLHWLGVDESESRQRIAAAVRALLEDTAKSLTRSTTQG